MALQFENVFPQFYDKPEEGEAINVLSNGKLFFFDTLTETEKDTFPDEDESGTPNPNPIILGDDGRSPVPIWLLESSYHFVVKDSDDNVINDLDPYVPLAISSSAYVSGGSYSINDRVRSAANTLRYVSLVDDNTADPTATPNANWTEERPIRVWNSLETYSEGDVSIYTDGVIYTSLADSNTNKIPPNSASFWQTSQSKIASGSLLIEVADYGTTVAVTGLGFQPRFLEMFFTMRPEAVRYGSGYGYANSTGDQKSVFTSAHVDGASSDLLLNSAGTTLLRVQIDGPAASPYVASVLLDSFDSDGFTLDVEETGGTLEADINVGWMASA